MADCSTFRALIRLFCLKCRQETTHIATGTLKEYVCGRCETRQTKTP